jgi:hypothetical protein
MPWYYGTGLHYSNSCPIQPLTKQLCGNHENRDDYQDSLLYDKPIIPDLLQNLSQFSLVRCKIGCINGADSQSQQISKTSGWHKDEYPHEVLRVIVPLHGDSSYLFELENHKPIPLLPGYVYAFDQSQWHKVYSSKPSDVHRVNLILSFVTWFNRVDDQWIPNDFCGKIHPLKLFDLIQL